ncbi:pyrroloquinoline quinone biosynthesis protein PqqE [Streptomyces sp. NPDC048483]|uniref:pyrroloquinoline quinone biosynthesis protein PqqE n=1 Tax=Streptomyces sp. NPDC048483 TaxID=3154927 RepID=UPI00343CB8D0
MTAASPARPWALLAELTHGCPLHCSYCSNPLQLTQKSAELTTLQWKDALRQAADLGVVSTHLSGGEPLLRPDLAAIVAAADGAGIHTQLVTSGVGLDRARLARLTDAGLRSVQLSVQHADPTTSDLIAGRRSFAAKERAAALVRAAGLPLGLNVVLHRHNLDALDALIDLAPAWGADRIELANTQFYGWALRNRAALLPSRRQLADAERTVRRRRAELADDRIEVVWVVPDYFDGNAKPCMGGWGALSLTITPDGTVLPCPAAAAIPGLDAPNVRDHDLEWIWNHSGAFTRYRGTEWMREPCRSCDLREKDFGGCRCQAHALTGDATATDPACRLSPHHPLLRDLVDTPPEPPAQGLGPPRRPARRVTAPAGDGRRPPMTRQQWVRPIGPGQP